MGGGMTVTGRTTMTEEDVMRMASENWRAELRDMELRDLDPSKARSLSDHATMIREASGSAAPSVGGLSHSDQTALAKLAAADPAIDWNLPPAEIVKGLQDRYRQTHTDSLSTGAAWAIYGMAQGMRGQTEAPAVPKAPSVQPVSIDSLRQAFRSAGAAP